jgi:ribosomal protein L40E
MSDQKKSLLIHEKVVPISIILIVLGLLSLLIPYALRDEKVLQIISLIFCFGIPTWMGLVIIIMSYLAKKGIVKGLIPEVEEVTSANETKTCSSCNAENPPENNFCEQCGNKL